MRSSRVDSQQVMEVLQPLMAVVADLQPLLQQAPSLVQPKQRHRESQEFFFQLVAAYIIPKAKRLNSHKAHPLSRGRRGVNVGMAREQARRLSMRPCRKSSSE